MAEFVQYRLEGMLSELEQMERVGLFSRQEIKAIIKKRKNFEYKIQRRTKCKEDFLKYIQYEFCLAKLLQKRRKEIEYYFKETELEHAIYRRIGALFRIIIYRCQADVDLWLSYIHFLKKLKWTRTISKILVRMLQVHSKKPELWIYAAKWEFEENNAPENARALFLRGLRFNLDSRNLWLEYYRMELLYVDKILKRREVLQVKDMEDDPDTSDAVLEGKIALIVLQNAHKEVQDPGFLLLFLPICSLFPFAASHEEHIYEEMVSTYSNNELTWYALARRKLDKQTEIVNKAIIEGQKKGKVIRELEKEAVAIFEDALEKLPTEKMYKLYLETWLERLGKPDLNKLVDKRVRRILSLFERAASKNFLTADQYAKWITVLLHVGLVSQAKSVASIALSKFPRCPELWKQMIMLELQLESSTEHMEALFKSALAALSEKESLLIWELRMQWATSQDKAKVRGFLEDISAMSQNGSILLKDLYLDLAMLHDGIQKTREVYEKCRYLPPSSFPFFQKMILYESTQPLCEVQKIRSYYEDAIQVIGKSSVDCWLEYIKFELKHPEANPLNASPIHWKAIKTLNANLVELFITKHTLFKTMSSS